MLAGGQVRFDIPFPALMPQFCACCVLLILFSTPISSLQLLCLSLKKPMFTFLSNSKKVDLAFRPTSKELEQTFKELKAAFSPATVPDDTPVKSYNMVLTNSFMMLVPRSREIYGPVDVNSMGFAGSMLVRSKEELDFLRAESPMQVLAAVGVPWSEEH